jgi:CHAD domain-containing protein
MKLSEYVQKQVNSLIDKLVAQAQVTERDTSDDAIQDLRTSIRRLHETLRVFEDLFPRGTAKTVRNDLRVAMRLAGDARNVDIARDLMVKAELDPSPSLTADRASAEDKLMNVLAGWNRGAAYKAWREQLNA